MLLYASVLLPAAGTTMTSHGNLKYLQGIPKGLQVASLTVYIHLSRQCMAVAAASDACGLSLQLVYD